jgi:hypothetical protein
MLRNVCNSLMPILAQYEFASATVGDEKFVPLIERRRRRRRRRLSHLCDCETGAVKKPLPASLSSFTPGPALMSVPTDKFMLPPKVKRQGWAPACPGVLCLFSGSKRWARSMVQKGAPWVLCFEICDSDASWSQDLLDPSVRTLIEALLLEGAITLFGAAPVCTSFSTAVTPPIRTSVYPAGAPWASPAAIKK